MVNPKHARRKKYPNRARIITALTVSAIIGIIIMFTVLIPNGPGLHVIHPLLLPKVSSSPVKIPHMTMMQLHLHHVRHVSHLRHLHYLHLLHMAHLHIPPA